MFAPALSAEAGNGIMQHTITAKSNTDTVTLFGFRFIVTLPVFKFLYAAEIYYFCYCNYTVYFCICQ